MSDYWGPIFSPAVLCHTDMMALRQDVTIKSTNGVALQTSTLREYSDNISVFLAGENLIVKENIILLFGTTYWKFVLSIAPHGVVQTTFTATCMYFLHVRHFVSRLDQMCFVNVWPAASRFSLQSTRSSKGALHKKKNNTGLFRGFSPTGGGGSPQSQNFCDLTK